MAVGTAFSSPLLDAGQVRKYAYRHRMGMVPSAEWVVFHDDFTGQVHEGTAVTNGHAQYQPEYNWNIILDSGATVAVNTTTLIGAWGVLTLADATASEGAAIYGEKWFQFISGKRAFIEARIYTNDVTDNSVQFGLSDLTATTDPEDLYDTTAANLATFGILDGSAYPTLLCDEANAGTAAIAQTSKLMVASTWHVLAMYYDGTNLHAYVDGDRVITTATTVPEAVALAPFFSHRNGNGAGGNVVAIDYLRVVSER